MTIPALSTFLAAAVIALASPAHAQQQIEMVISGAGQRDENGAILVDLRLLNGTSEEAALALPDKVEGVIRVGGSDHNIWLERTVDGSPNLSLAAGSFARARYRIVPPPDLPLDDALLTVPAWGAAQVTIALRPTPEIPRLAQGAAPSEDGSGRTLAAPPSADRAAGNAFLGNLSAYEPIYAVYGPGTNSEARLQISFKYQLFGTRRAEGLPRSWRDGLHFAFTQRMFWDLGAHSSPFRNIDFQPEIFYLTPSATLSNGMSISVQGGLRHESNGRSGEASRSINSLYIAPMAAIPLGSGYNLSIAPRLSLFVGDKSDNPDLRRYRGNTGLFVEVGEENGLRLTTSTRFNFSTGKGAIAADLSYPLPRLLGGGPDFYLFGQSFTGYGENLLDYDRRTTRFRIGVALVR